MRPGPGSGALAVCLAIAPTARGQSSGFLSQVRLRAGVFDSRAVAKPAQLQATWPDGARAHYSLDAGLTLDLVPRRSPAAASWKVGPFVEYHRRTQLEKEQDSLLAGVSVLNIAGDPARMSHYTQLTAEYVRDAVEDTEGAQGSVLYMPLVPRWAIGLARGPDALRVLWQPAVGVEYEHVAKAGEGRPTGSVARLNAGVDLAFYPADGRLKKRLEIALSWTYWRDFAEASGLDDGRDSHRRWKATLSYAVDAGGHVTLGLDFLDGEDPSRGLADQRYATFALGLKY